VAPPVQQAARPAVETAAPVVGSVAGAPETAIEPVQQAAEPVTEPVREVARPVAEQANGVVEPAVEPVVAAAEPVRQAVKPATELAIEPALQPAVPARGVSEPGVRSPEPVTRPAVKPVAEPVIESAVRAARLGGAPQDGRAVGARIEPVGMRAVGSDVVPLRERTMAGSDVLDRPEPAAASMIARDTAVLHSATLADQEDTVPRVVAAKSSFGLVDLYELFGRAVSAGERYVVGITSAAVGGASGQTPQPLVPFGGVPAGVGTSGGLGAGSGVGGAGLLAVLALLLFMLRAGGSLSWLSYELPRPNSALIEITERPG